MTHDWENVQYLSADQSLPNKLLEEEKPHRSMNSSGRTGEWNEFCKLSYKLNDTCA